MNALAALRSKLLKPWSCRKLLRIFRFKLRRPLFIKRLRILRPNKHRRKMDRVMQLRSASKAAEQDSMKLLLSFPPSSSPVTPAYIKAFRAATRDGPVEDSCRSFENYLVEMIVEEGKMNDLTDVEELRFAGRTSSPLSSLTWSADSMVSCVGTCLLQMMINDIQITTFS